MKKEYAIMLFVSVLLLGFVFPFLFSAKSTILVLIGCAMLAGYVAALYFILSEPIKNFLKEL